MTDARYQRHPDVRMTELEGEGVVLHLGERRYFSLNESGVTMLRALEAPQSLADLVGLLQLEYEVSADQADQAAQAFVEQCLASAVVVELGK
jgi:hypothetical protein